MIFSKEKWNGGKEISAYVPTSSSLSFQKMESSLSSAQQMFLLPLVESKLMHKIEDAYASQDTASDDPCICLLSPRGQWQTSPSGMISMR